MDIPSTASSESSTSADADTGVVYSAPSTSDWIKNAVTLRRYGTHETHRQTRTEAKKPRVPLWISEPEPAPLPEHQRPCRLSVLASERWHDEWHRRDLDEAARFFKYSDPDEQLVHDIIRVGDPLL